MSMIRERSILTEDEGTALINWADHAREHIPGRCPDLTAFIGGVWKACFPNHKPFELGKLGDHDVALFEYAFAVYSGDLR